MQENYRNSQLAPSSLSNNQLRTFIRTLWNKEGRNTLASRRYAVISGIDRAAVTVDRNWRARIDIVLSQRSDFYGGRKLQGRGSEQFPSILSCGRAIRLLKIVFSLLAVSNNLWRVLVVIYNNVIRKTITMNLIESFLKIRVPSFLPLERALASSFYDN